MTHLDLFSGIGGFAYAIDQVWDDVEHIFCDNEPFAQKVISKHWKGSRIYGDIREIDTNPFDTGLEGGRQKATGHGGQSGGEQRHEAPFILTGGFPCQPFSAAGLRRGTSDDRHLWPEMLRVIRLTQPEWVIAENVRGLLTLEGGVVFEQVCLDLEAAGYQVQPFVVPAVAVNAPHRRDRVWFVAHAVNSRQGGTQRGSNGKPSSLPKKHRPKDSPARQLKRTDSDGEADGYATDTESLGTKRRVQQQGSNPQFRQEDWEQDWLEVATGLCSVDDGLSKGMVRFPDGTRISKAQHRKEALKAYGNAIVPQVAEQIFRAIRTSDENM